MKRRGKYVLHLSRTPQDLWPTINFRRSNLGPSLADQRSRRRLPQFNPSHGGREATRWCAHRQHGRPTPIALTRALNGANGRGRDAEPNGSDFTVNRVAGLAAHGDMQVHGGQWICGGAGVVEFARMPESMSPALRVLIFLTPERRLALVGAARKRRTVTAGGAACRADACVRAEVAMATQEGR
jgi:hypothetical protein